MQHILGIDGTANAVWLARSGNGYHLHLDGRAVPVSLDDNRLWFDGRAQDVVAVVDGDVVHILIDGQTHAVRYVDAVQHFASEGAQSADDVVLAPMPGTVVAVHVAAGDKIEVGQTMIVIESMKLETTIKAWRDGKVSSVHVGKGEQFERQAPLVTLAPAEGGS